MANKGDKEQAASEVRDKPGERVIWKPSEDCIYFQEKGTAKNVSNATDRSGKKRPRN